MKIWIIDHYAVPERYCPLIRQTIFARKLTAHGHRVRIFAASTVHNSDINLIKSKEKFKEEFSDGVQYTYVRCHNYKGNGLRRVLNMYEFANRLPKVCDIIADREGEPDVILACSMTSFACRRGIQIAKKYGAKAIAQISDIWPEDLVEYGYTKRGSLVEKYFLKIEKWNYINADCVIFTCEGGYDYIKEQHWESEIPREKVKYINNGVDLARFYYNKQHYRIKDKDLNNQLIYKIIYTGSIRKANNLGLLLDVAKEITDDSIKFLIWGAGDELEYLQKRAMVEEIDNVSFKGRVEKKYIPYITSSADINIAHGNPSKLFRFGISFNKIFDYFAAGKPIIADFCCKYNPIVEERAGVSVDNPTVENIVETIYKMRRLDDKKYACYCKNAILAAKKYDFDNLTRELEGIIAEIK